VNRRVVVTGTGTGVGKTVVTAAIAALAAANRSTITVVKPAQTGLGPGDESDVDAVRRLSGVSDVHELVRYDAALAPASAARVAGVAATPVPDLANRIGALPESDLLVVEGAGGLLVRLDGDGNTVADLAQLLRADVLVVAAAGLGTLNATALTTEALRRRGLDCAGVVIGSWPDEPGAAELANLTDLPSYAEAQLLGALPEGAGARARAEFADLARVSLAPSLGGTWQRIGVDISV
jgi:dethiobiotin synthetase